MRIALRASACRPRWLGQAGPWGRRRDAVRLLVRAGAAGRPGDAGPWLPGSHARIRVAGRPAGQWCRRPRWWPGPWRLRPGDGRCDERARRRAEGPGFAYPDGRLALDGVDVHIHPGERVAPGAERGGQDDPGAPPQRHPAAPAGDVEIAGIPVKKEIPTEVRRRVGMVFQDPDDHVFMPTVHEDVAFGPANLGPAGRRTGVRVRRRWPPWGWRTGAAGPAPSVFGERRGCPSPPSSPWTPSSWSSTNPPPTSTRPGGGNWPSAAGPGLTKLMVTHDLPFVLQSATGR